jgi:hypothetical protein
MVEFALRWEGYEVERKSTRTGVNLICLCVLGGYAIAAGPAEAAVYSGAILYSLNPPASSSDPFVMTDATAGQVVGYSYTESQAVVWSAPSGSNAELLPSGINAALVNATDGTHQIGFGRNGANWNAMLWSGSAASAINLNPTGFTQSYGEGVLGSQQVGYGYGKTTTNNNDHALVWSNAASSVMDLNPSAFTISEALGTNGAKQVGFGTPTADYNSDLNTISHALMWFGTAASAVDLGPAGFTASNADGIDAGGTQEVGSGTPTGDASNVAHALLWYNTASSAVDLNPAGATNSFALATNGSFQVGSADGDATLWYGTADSAVDLNALLPSTDTWTTSSATSIDSAGNIYGYAEDAAGNYDAVEWSPVPEPTSAALLGLGAIGLLARHRG